MENTVFVIKDETEYIEVKEETISEEQDPLSINPTGSRHVLYYLYEY